MTLTAEGHKIVLGIGFCIRESSFWTFSEQTNVVRGEIESHPVIMGQYIAVVFNLSIVISSVSRSPHNRTDSLWCEIDDCLIMSNFLNL
jgi:hypothetical protein